MKKYFDEQPCTRPEQLAVLKKKLAAQFERKYPTLGDIPIERLCHAYGSVDPYEHCRMIYVAMRAAAFIRHEDNSLYGFRRRCPAGFRNDEE